MIPSRYRPTLLGLGLALTMASSASTADLEKFTPQHVARIRAVVAAAIAPDGSKVAYLLSVPRRLASEEDGPSWTELHVVGRDGKSRPYLTGEVNVADVQWSPTGTSLLFLARRGKDEHRSLYQIDLEGGEARRVLSFGSDITAYSLKSDGKRLAFLATEPESKARADQKKKGFTQIVYEEELKPVKIWLSALESATPPIPVKLPGSASELHASPDSDAIAVALAPTPGVDDSFTSRKVYATLSGPGGLLRFDNPGKLGKVTWSPDGKHLAMISAADKHDPAAGRLVVASTETGEMKDILPGYGGHVADLAWLDADTLVFLGDEGTATVLGKVEADGSGLTSVQTGEVVATSLSIAKNGRMAIVGQTSKHPSEVFEGGDHNLARLTDSNPWLANMAFAPQTVEKYKARDGLELEGILISPLPTGDAKGPSPLVLDVHGGPESHVKNGWVTSYSMPGQVLAAQGIAVFLPNYRGSTGRGVEFSKLSQGDPAGKEFDDLVDAVDHFIATGLADGSKVGVTGGSYGGYATAWCSTRFSDRFAAGVMFVGISDKISKTGTTDIPDEEYLVHARRRPWDDWHALLEHSPIYHVDKARTPLLIMHGKEDPRVFPGQSLELYRFLKLRGQAPVRLVLYPGEGHGNLRAASRLDYNLRMVAWLTHYLKGPGGTMPSAEIKTEG